MNLIPFPIPIIILILCFILLAVQHEWVGKRVMVFPVGRIGTVIDARPDPSRDIMLTVKFHDGRVIQVAKGLVGDP